MDTKYKDKLRYIRQFFFDSGDYGPDTVAANQAQFLFHRIRSGKFEVM